LIPYEEALQVLEARFESFFPSTEDLPLGQAVGRVLAMEIVMDRSEPPVSRSAMDGFAMQSGDGISERCIIGTFFAGTPGSEPVGPGQAVAVMTGGTVPPGADCVVPVERTRREGDTLWVEESPSAGQHVRQAGEMGEAGRVLLQPGRCLSEADLGAIAGCGVDPVTVARRPKVVILATGDEVVPFQGVPEAHQVRDSNRLLVAAQLRGYGMEVLHEEHVADVEVELQEAVGRALLQADLLVTIGGVSMGEKDFLPKVFAEAGVERLFHKIDLQPGKPVWAGVKEGCFVLGLPGNPLSSFVVTELLGRFVADRLQGGVIPFPRTMSIGRFHGSQRSGARPRFLAARFCLGLSSWDQTIAAADNLPHLELCSETGSGDWTSLAMADALVFLPPRNTADDGDAVRFLPL
jgi:molybdopterin molybdotransferase